MARKDTKLATKNRRKTLICKTFSCKIILNKLNKNTKNHLYKLFLEAKWLYNYILSQEDIFKFDTKTKTAKILNKDKIPEYKTINCLSAQMRQEIYIKIKNSILLLNKNKKKGNKIGKLKFKSIFKTIPLRQNSQTYKILDKNYIKIQGIKTKIKVKGLYQIPENAEIANANLIKQGKDFYINITCFLPKKDKAICEFDNVGIDIGCTTQLTLSDGIKIQYEVPVNTKIKKLDRKIAKSKSKNKKKTKNCFKLLQKREKEYLHLNNKKKDIKNKIVNVLTNNYNTIICQDENVLGWKNGRHGKKIQNTALKGIILDLKSKSNTFIEVDRFFPSTKTCSFCKNKQNVLLSERVYTCTLCNKSIDRDINASINILQEGLKEKIPTEHRFLERNTSALIKLTKISGINISILSTKEEVNKFTCL